MFSFLRRKSPSKDRTEEERPIEQPFSNENADQADSASSEANEDSAKIITTATHSEIEKPAAEQPGLVTPETDFAETPTVPAESIAESEPLSSPENIESRSKAPKEKKKGLFTRLKLGLSKTRRSFTDSIANLVLGRKEIDDDLLDELEMVLLTADVGVEATDRIISNLTEQVSRKELKEPEALISALKKQLQEIIEPVSQTLDVDATLSQQQGPYVILMVGINGVGKTTTIGKLAKKFQNEGKSVMLAAGDTFRAAAVEQLQTWGERNHVPVMAQKTGADSAAVIFDAIQSAKAKNIDILIADTAGRLHTQSNLMEELKKVKRVMGKIDQSAPHEVMLVIDAGTGQNALNQAQQFREAVDVSGITVTKLDGTAKGGIVFALAEKLAIPVRFIGVGESIDDLRPFQAKEFTEALFDRNNAS